VQDRGKGIPLKRQQELNSTDRAGVGFRGMRERIRQLDGSFEIQSDSNGTVIVASLPVPHS
jgi:signal transduction histidine kinase